MLLTTKGIVLHSVKYSETSIIVRIYTEARGLQSYLFRGIRSPKSKIKAGLFQPLTLLELVANIREGSGMHHASEVRLYHPYLSIPFDIRKSSVALFINELLYKSVREEEENSLLFSFLWDACLLLDSETESLNCFPLVFASKLTGFLGILPVNDHSDSRTVFNLREGRFQSFIPEKEEYILPEYGSLFRTLLSTELEAHHSLHLKPAVRRSFLDSLLLYYQIHLPGFKGLNSHHILHSVLA